MTSKIKVDNINKVSDDTNIIKKCGTTTTIGSGASNPIVVDGSAVTLGRCGGTVALASGATQTGFGRTGTVDWQTSIKTSTITAVNGEGYFVNTTGGSITANLPAGVVGAIVSFKDYAQTFDTNSLTISANGSEKIEGLTTDLILSTEGLAVTLVYGDATKGWQAVNSNEITNVQTFVTATGGTITCSGDFKIHTFTGPGTFTVTGLSGIAANNKVSYVVVGGGAGGGFDGGGGGGAGGYREGKNTPVDSYTASPLAAACSGHTVTATGYPITVGGGGPGTTSATCTPNGANSGFSSFIGAGGGGAGAGGGNGGYNVGNNGGSGGGGAGSYPASGDPGGSGNTPATIPAQGFDGGFGAGFAYSLPGTGGGGGGATSVGVGGSGPTGPTPTRGNGGAGATSSINATPTTRAGGGGGGGYSPNGITAGSGGPGGGGAGSDAVSGTGTAGTTNTGGGAGGGAGAAGNGANGGSGIVIIRYKFQ